MIRQLQPWHENIAKRQVKAPKIYLRDSGLLHSLLSLFDMHTLLGHPRVGASWEGFALEQFLHVVQPSEVVNRQSHILSPVHSKHFTGDEPSPVAAEEGDNLGDILDAPHPAEKNLVSGLLARLRRHGFENAGLDQTRCDGIDGHVASRQFFGQGLGEPDDAGFRG